MGGCVKCHGSIRAQDGQNGIYYQCVASNCGFIHGPVRTYTMICRMCDQPIFGDHGYVEFPDGQFILMHDSCKENYLTWAGNTVAK